MVPTDGGGQSGPQDDDTRRLEQQAERKAQYEAARAVEARRQEQAKEDQGGEAQKVDQGQAGQGDGPAVERSEANRFRLMIRNSLAHMTPEQRTCVAEEVARVQLASLAKVAEPHAELQANEANKIATAEEAVRPRIPSAPPGGEAGLIGPGAGHVLDMSQYEKVGEQWRMCLGSVAGQMQYRWLSTAEAKSLGLEPPKGINERIDQLYQGQPGSLGGDHDPGADAIDGLGKALGNDERIDWKDETDPRVTRKPLDPASSGGA